VGIPQQIAGLERNRAMRGWKFVLGLAVLTGMQHSTMAQDGPKAVPLQSASSKNATATQRQLQLAAKSAVQLREQSRESFLRGLLPLQDYLEHLSTAFEAEGRSAYETTLGQLRSTPGYESNKPPQLTVQQRQKTFEPVYQARLAALQEAVDRLVEFQQPASVGWEADVALSRFALVQAQTDAARVYGKPGDVLQLKAGEEQLAVEQYWKRWDDASVGLASTQQLVQAVSLLNVAPELRRNFLQNAENQTVIWASAGAGIGRQDAVTKASFDLTWLNGYTEGQDGKRVVNEQSWRESDQLVETLFQQQREFFPKGTATLGDLSRTWNLREQMHHVATDAKYKMPGASIEQHRQNLQLLQRTADGTTDRRGRHAADVTFVQVLAQLKAAEPTP
jgi:hypothetical protein